MHVSSVLMLHIVQAAVCCDGYPVAAVKRHIRDAILANFIALSCSNTIIASQRHFHRHAKPVDTQPSTSTSIQLQRHPLCNYVTCKYCAKG